VALEGIAIRRQLSRSAATIPSAASAEASDTPPAAADPLEADDYFIDEAELDALIRPAGAMVSRRFPRVS